MITLPLKRQTKEAMRTLSRTTKAIVWVYMVFILSGCYYEIKEPFPVTYEVGVCSTIKEKVHIIYFDSTGFVSVTTDSAWRKSVVLPPGEMAMLTVYPVRDFYSALEPRLNDYTEYFWEHYYQSPYSIWSAAIIHPEKNVRKISSSMYTLTLSQEDIILYRRKGWKMLNPFLPAPKTR